MFKIIQSRTHTAPVTFKTPAAGGTYQTNSFMVEFKRLSVSEVKQLPQDATDADIARRVVVGWNEVEDGQGNPMPFSADGLEKLLDIVGVAPAIVRTYFECVSGAQEKN